MKKALLSIIVLCVAGACYAGVGKYVGGDISALPLYEAASTRYKDASGQTIPDLLTWLHNTCGWNTFRVRIFVNPQKKGNTGSADSQVAQDLTYVRELGKRIKDAGCYFMLDFHYSDTWVDATHIQAPDAWKNCTPEQMADSVGAYTRLVLDSLNAAGATPDLVQVGNEIMYGMCGIQVHPYAKQEDNWDGFTNLLKAGSEAVREKCPDAQIILHTDRVANIGYNRYWYNRVIQMGVDFDIIGVSYYPFWHGYLTAEQAQSQKGSATSNNLERSLAALATDFPSKAVHIVETAYNFQWWPSSGVNYDTRSLWPCTKAGQYQFVADMVDFLADYPQVEGLSYWMPEEAGNGDSKTVIENWLNRGLWDSTKGNHTLNKKSTTEYAQLKMQDFLDSSTDVSEQHADDLRRLMMRNGRIVITRAGQRYDMVGRSIR